MPSLRRSFSSPSVRSSPYPSSSATTSTIRSRAAAPHPHPRRLPGATAERRVLADIEWWRVHAGQCDPDILEDQVRDDVQAESDVPPGGTVMLSAGGGPIEPQTPLSLYSFSSDSMQPVYLDVLSIVPYSPSRRSRDSVESTPELSTTPLETDQLGLANQMTCPFGLYPPSLTRGRQAHPLFGLRSVSAPGLSRQGTFEPDFADIGGDSFSLNQNLFQ